MILNLIASATSNDSTLAILDSTKSVVSKLSSPETYTSGEFEKIISSLIETATSMAVSLVGKLLLAIIVFLIGKWIIAKIKNLFARIFERRNVDPSLASFFKSLINIVLVFILAIIIIDILGLETSSFVALFASAGVAVGLALSGTLQNFAGGVMILLFRPYKVNDYIEAQGFQGTVKEIQIFNSIIQTADGKTIILPNGALSTSVVTNYSRLGSRRVEWTFGIGYGDDLEKAKQLIRDVLDKEQMILKDPKPTIALKELNSSSVDIVVLAWVNIADYFPALYSINEQVYLSFNENGINIPYPQMDVHLVK